MLRICVKNQKGLTLIEIMVAIAILGMMAVLLFQSIDGMLDSQEEVVKLDDATHLATNALNKIFDDLQASFLIKSPVMLGDNPDYKIGFMGKEDRLDFNSFSHRRFVKDQKETEVAEIGYYLKSRDDLSGVYYLMRRESSKVDQKTDEGGRSDILLDNVKSLQLEYYDSRAKEYTKTWDTFLGSIQDRLPRAVKVTLTVYLDLNVDSLNDEANQFVYRVIVPIALSQKAIEL